MQSAKMLQIFFHADISQRTPAARSCSRGTGHAGRSRKGNNSESTTRPHDFIKYLSLHCKTRRLRRALAGTFSYVHLHAMRQLPLELNLTRDFMHFPEQMMMCLIEFLVRISHCTADLYRGESV